MVEDGKSARFEKRYVVFVGIFAISAVFVFLFSDQAKTISNLRIKIFSVTPTIPPDLETTAYSSGNINHTSLEDETFSVLEPPSQKWAQEQFKKALVLMDQKYSQPSMWENCGMQTYYFEKIKTIFTGIPKTGCSNWIEALLRANGDLKTQLNPTEVKKVHGGISNKHRIPKILNRLNASEFQQAFSFTVVRNPWTRMVSGYRDKLSDEKTQGGSFRSIGKKIVKEMRCITNKQELDKLYPTFTEFALWLAKHYGSGNKHFHQQFRTLCIPAAKYDYIIPLEYAGLLSQDVWGRINASTSLLGSYDESSDPRLQRSALYAKEWFSKIDENTIEKLYNIFRIDFALMDYSNFTHPNFPLPLHDSK